MKNQLAAYLTALGLILSSSALTAAPAAKTEQKKPTLTIDTTPVGDAKAPVVTSYAEVLATVRPAVVSVYSSKIVRQQVPPMFRQMFGNAQGPEQRMDGLGSYLIDRCTSRAAEYLARQR